MSHGDYGFLKSTEGQVACPYCSKSFDKDRDTSTGDPLIHHVIQAYSHPYGDYREFQADLRASDLKPHPNHPTADASDTAQDPANAAEDLSDDVSPESAEADAEAAQATANEGGADPSPEATRTPTAVRLTSEAPQGNPLLRAPVVATDGGTSECPDCEGELESAKEGHEVQLRHKGDARNESEPPLKGTTDGNEQFCPDCNTMVLADGEAMDIVGIKQR